METLLLKNNWRRIQQLLKIKDIVVGTKDGTVTAEKLFEKNCFSLKDMVVATKDGNVKTLEKNEES